MRTPLVRPSRVALLVVALLAIAASVFAVERLSDRNRHLTAVFSRTTSLYEGARVKVLGVDVGEVTAIEVDGSAVRVDMTYDSDVSLPADVHAVIVPPSVVGDRFVQLAPAYVSGPTLADRATLGLERTAVPVELDETFRSLDELATALGPEGANREGALSDLVTATADALEGNGRDVNEAILEFGELMETLADASPDIGGTVDELADVSRRLAGDDRDIRRIVEAFAGVSSELNDDGEVLTDAIERLSRALDLLHDFTKEHRVELASSVERLSEISGVLAARTEELDDLLKLAPVGLTSLLNSAEQTNYDPTNLSASRPEGRTNSAGLRGAFFEDLDVLVAHAVSGLCGQLPDPAATSLAPLCALLTEAGENVGALLNEAIRKGLGAAGTRGPTSLVELLGGAR